MKMTICSAWKQTTQRHRPFDNHHHSLQGIIPKGQRSAGDKTATRVDAQDGGERRCVWLSTCKHPCSEMHTHRHAQSQF